MTKRCHIYIEALKAYEESNSVEAQIILNNISLCYAYMGDFSNAKNLLTKALRFAAIIIAVIIF